MTSDVRTPETPSGGSDAKTWLCDDPLIEATFLDACELYPPWGFNKFFNAMSIVCFVKEKLGVDISAKQVLDRFRELYILDGDEFPHPRRVLFTLPGHWEHKRQENEDSEPKQDEEDDDSESEDSSKNSDDEEQGAPPRKKQKKDIKKTKNRR